MAEKVLEKSVCETCGADVRPHSMFCYNCGGAVSGGIAEESAVESAAGGETEVGDVLLRDDFSEKPESEIETESETKAGIIEADLPAAALETKAEVTEEKKGIQDNAKLKSAAAMRRKAKSFQAKQVEVIWEEPQNSASVKLILVALLLTLFAIGIVYLALSLK